MSIFSLFEDIPPVDLALGQPVNQSSTYLLSGSSFPASLVVDGVVATEWRAGIPYHCSSTNDPPRGPNWFMVDLGRITTILYVALTNRYDNNSE